MGYNGSFSSLTQDFLLPGDILVFGNLRYRDRSGGGHWFCRPRAATAVLWCKNFRHFGPYHCVFWYIGKIVVSFRQRGQKLFAPAEKRITADPARREQSCFYCPGDHFCGQLYSCFKGQIFRNPAVVAEICIIFTKPGLRDKKPAVNQAITVFA